MHSTALLELELTRGCAVARRRGLQKNGALCACTSINIRDGSMVRWVNISAASQLTGFQGFLCVFRCAQAGDGSAMRADDTLKSIACHDIWYLSPEEAGRRLVMVGTC